MISELIGKKGSQAFHGDHGKLRKCARLLAFESVVLAHQGKGDEALRTYQVILKLAKAAEGPIILPQMVSYAIRDLGDRAFLTGILDSHMSAPACRALATQIARIDQYTPLVKAFKGERVSGIWIFDYLRETQNFEKVIMTITAPPGEVIKTKGTGSSRPKTQKERLLYMAVIDEDELAYLKAMDQMIRDSKLPWLNSIDNIHNFLTEAKQESKSSRPRTVSEFILINHGNVLERQNYTQVALDRERIALLLKAYKTDHGMYPESLQELASAEKTTFRDDPFSGKPYTYRRQGDGFLLYSWGINMQNDGGAPYRSTGCSVKSGDIVLMCNH